MRLSATLDHSTRDAGADVYWANGVEGTPDDVAFVDSGLDCTHPAFALSTCRSAVFHTNAAAGTCYNDVSTSTDDLQGHGTHVAGILASSHSVNTGMARDVGDLVNVKAGYRDCSGGGSFNSFDIRDGLHWVVTLADTPEAINLSLGGSSNSHGTTALENLLDAIVTTLRIAVVVAAGNIYNGGCNGGTTTRVGIPAAAFNVITVGNADDRATDHPSDNTLNASSCVGPTGDNRMKPDLVAPGTAIASAAHNWEGNNPDWVEKSGTSMAAPHVAGAIVLMTSHHGGHPDPLPVKAQLMATALKTTNTGAVPNTNWGYGNLFLDWTWSNRNYYVTGDVAEGAYRWFKADGYVASGDRYTLVWERHSAYRHDAFPTDFATRMSDLDFKLWRESSGAQDTGSVSATNFEWLQPSTAFNDGIFTVRGYSVVGGGVERLRSEAPARA